MRNQNRSEKQIQKISGGERLTEFLCGILFTFSLIALAVSFVLYFRPLYYLDVKLLDLDGSYGLNALEIRRNYDALIRYNSPFFFGALQFPDLPSSREALIHFAEVKRIFMLFQLAGVVSILILLPLLRLQKKRGLLARTLRTSAITAVLLPSLVGLAIALNFDKAFVLFHKLFFRNDYWLFDPVTDPIILLLPDTFFLHCAVGIVLLVLLGSLILYLFSRRIADHGTLSDEA